MGGLSGLCTPCATLSPPPYHSTCLQAGAPCFCQNPSAYGGRAPPVEGPVACPTPAWPHCTQLPILCRWRCHWCGLYICLNTYIYAPLVRHIYSGVSPGLDCLQAGHETLLHYLPTPPPISQNGCTRCTCCSANKLHSTDVCLFPGWLLRCAAKRMCGLKRAEEGGGASPPPLARACAWRGGCLGSAAPGVCTWARPTLIEKPVNLMCADQ